LKRRKTSKYNLYLIKQTQQVYWYEQRCLTWFKMANTSKR